MSNLLRCIVCGNFSMYCSCPQHPTYESKASGPYRHELPDGTVVRRRLRHLALICTEDQP